MHQIHFSFWVLLLGAYLLGNCTETTQSQRLPNKVLGIHQAIKQVA